MAKCIIITAAASWHVIGGNELKTEAYDKARIATQQPCRCRGKRCEFLQHISIVHPPARYSKTKCPQQPFNVLPLRLQCPQQLGDERKARLVDTELNVFVAHRHHAKQHLRRLEHHQHRLSAAPQRHPLDPRHHRLLVLLLLLRLALLRDDLHKVDGAAQVRQRLEHRSLSLLIVCDHIELEELHQHLAHVELDSNYLHRQRAPSPYHHHRLHRCLCARAQFQIECCAESRHSSAAVSNSEMCCGATSSSFPHSSAAVLSSRMDAKSSPMASHPNSHTLCHCAHVNDTMLVCSRFSSDMLLQIESASFAGRKHPFVSKPSTRRTRYAPPQH